MSEVYELHAEPRYHLGKGHNRRMRSDNKIPAVIYGAGQEPEHFSLDHNKVIKALENEAFYSHILTVNLEGKTHKAVLKAMQRHPFKPKVLHMDFLRISDKEKLFMNIPLHFNNEEKAPGVKLRGGIVSHLETSVEISCLPADLPEFIDVEMGNLDLDQTVHLSDLKLPKGVEFVDLSHGNDRTIASIHLPRAAVEAEATPVSAEVPTHRDDQKTEE